MVVRFRPGTAGAAAANGVLAAAEVVRRRLAGFGNESWGIPVQLCLVDPFPDPGRPDQLVSEGTVVDAALGEVWMVVDDAHPAGPVGGALALTERTMRLARTPFETSTEFLIDVLDTRAHVSELALRAAQSALLHQGARGYLMSSAVQRRVRESHFVAIVTPAVKHLRKEIARLSATVVPA